MKQKGKIKILLAIILAFAVLTGCGKAKEPTYEGGNLAISYDTGKWELSYKEASPYPVFLLSSEEAEITIMTVESNGSVLKAFHDDIMYLWESDEKLKEDKTDKLEKEGYLYFEDTLSDQDEKWELILYGRRKENMFTVGCADISLEESEEIDKELRNEILEIFSSMTYSDQEETGELEQDTENENILYIYEMLLNSLKYGEDTEAGKEADKENVGREAFSSEEIEELTYIEKIMVEDYYGDKTSYEAYGPKEREEDGGYISYFGHGLFYSAMAYNMGTDSYLYSFVDEIVEDEKERWLSEDSGCSNVEVSDMMKNGDDRYFIAKVTKEDYNEVPYEQKTIYYIDASDTVPGAGVLWELEVSENTVDDETDLIIDELAGCYGIDASQMKTGGEWSKNNEERIVKEQDEYEQKEGDLPFEKAEGYQYMGITSISVETGSRKAQCQVMAPMGQHTSARGNHVSANMHGVRITANIDLLMQQNLMATVKMGMDSKYKNLKEDDDIRNVTRSEMAPVSGFEEAYCVTFDYEEKDHITEEFEDKTDVGCYIRLNEDFDLEYHIILSDADYDDATNTVLEELEAAYGIDLPDAAGRKESADVKGKEERVTMAQLLGGSGEEKEEETDQLPDTVLWFNATYAPLTYSNGWNWRLVSGLERTQSNIELQKALLASSWDVRDRKSALETVEKMKETGHRGKCRECMEELKELGLLDLDEKAFLEQFSKSGIKEDAGRYVIAYFMHQEGVDADYIAAWDLCRVNQLYADYYFCGYMTYEEAMDASLENSLILQQTYSSWEEMVDAYMLGYQFWQGDLGLTDDSPTEERYQYYKMLQQMKDGPYTLDWDMELTKSW